MLFLSSPILLLLSIRPLWFLPTCVIKRTKHTTGWKIHCFCFPKTNEYLSCFHINEVYETERLKLYIVSFQIPAQSLYAQGIENTLSNTLKSTPYQQDTYDFEINTNIRRNYRLMYHRVFHLTHSSCIKISEPVGRTELNNPGKKKKKKINKSKWCGMMNLHCLRNYTLQKSHAKQKLGAYLAHYRRSVVWLKYCLSTVIRRNTNLISF